MEQQGRKVRRGRLDRLELLVHRELRGHRECRATLEQQVRPVRTERTERPCCRARQILWTRPATTATSTSILRRTTCLARKRAGSGERLFR